MADVPSVLLLASAASAAGGHGEEENPSRQQRVDRRTDPGDAAPLVCRGGGHCQGKRDAFTFFFFNETKRVLKFLLSPHGYITLGLFCWMFAHMWTGQVVI